MITAQTLTFPSRMPYCYATPVCVAVLLLLLFMPYGCLLLLFLLLQVSGGVTAPAENGTAVFTALRLRAQEGLHHVNMTGRSHDPPRDLLASQVKISREVGGWIYSITAIKVDNPKSLRSSAMRKLSVWCVCGRGKEVYVCVCVCVEFKGWRPPSYRGDVRWAGPLW